MARSASLDPVEKFRFQVSFLSGERLSRAGFMSATLPTESRSVIEYREGNYADTKEKSSGLTAYSDIVLSRGVTADQDFYSWCEEHKKHKASVRGNAGGAYTSDDKRPEDEAINAYRRDLQIELLDREGAVVKRWKIYNCWVSEMVPGDGLDANAEEKLMNSLTLAHEGFEEEV